jgi:hypothetical protein
MAQILMFLSLPAPCQCLILETVATSPRAAGFDNRLLWVPWVARYGQAIFPIYGSIIPTASLNFFSCFELHLSLPSCPYRSRSRRLTVLLNGCSGQKKGRGLKADRFVLTTRGFKDQWDRMLNSLRASRSGKVQQTLAFTMRAIRLVIALLHPSDQRQFQLLGPMP